MTKLALPDTIESTPRRIFSRTYLTSHAAKTYVLKSITELNDFHTYQGEVQDEMSQSTCERAYIAEYCRSQLAVLNTEFFYSADLFYFCSGHSKVCPSSNNNGSFSMKLGHIGGLNC